MIKFKQVLLAAAILCAGATASAANLVDNGGFETGSFSGWSLTGNTGYSGVTGNFLSIAPSEGAFQAHFGAVGSDGNLAQSLAVSSTDHYIVSFDLADFGGTSQDFSASFGGTTLLSLGNASVSGYTHYSFDVLGGNGTLEFSLRNDPSYWLLDNVSVTAAISAVPEASSNAMLLAGVAMLGFAALRRRSAR